MSATVAWAVIIIGYVLPLIHVGFTRGLTVPVDTTGTARCPFSPRLGWLVLVVFLGPIGWGMFILSRRRLRSGP